MLENIKKSIFSKFQTTDNKGLFFSAFDENGKLLFSKGVISSDKPLSEIVEKFYYGIIDKSKATIKVLVADVVNEATQLSNPNDILGTSPSQYGFLITTVDGEKSGLLLPDTYGVADAKNALYLVRQKYGLDGKVIIYRFTTTRIVMNS